VTNTRKVLESQEENLTRKQVKVLYVCPFAHYPGHPPWAALNEPVALKEAGADVKLLTFCGIIDNFKAQVPATVVMPAKYGLAHRFFWFVRRWTPTRWVLMLLETASTIAKAIDIKHREGFDVIYLRDGEPFLFMSHLLSLRFKGLNWIVSLTAANIYLPKMPKFGIRSFPLMTYILVSRFVINSPVWRLLYRISLRRNNFRFVTQNRAAEREYNEYLGGVFGNRVQYLPIGAGNMNHDIQVNKREARRTLGLPQRKPIFLSFGAPHSGKDLDVIFRALQGMPDVHLVHAGKQAFSLGSNLALLAKRYGTENRTVVKDHYIPEEEKPYYFYAADAVILSYTRQFLSTSSLLWEACLFGTPIIASDNGQLKELMEAFQPGLLFTAQDADSLKEAIIHFINLKPEEIEVLKSNCRRFANEFSIERWAQKCLEICDGLLIK